MISDRLFASVSTTTTSSVNSAEFESLMSKAESGEQEVQETAKMYEGKSLREVLRQDAIL